MANTMVLAYLEAVVGADTNDFKREMGRVRQDLLSVEKTAAQSMRNVGTSLTWGLTAPLAAFGAAAVSESARFEAEMRNINSIAQMTEDQLEGIAQKTLTLGKNTVSGPVAAAESLYTVFSAGIVESEKAFEVMEQSVMTAEAGMAELDITTEALVSTILAYSAHSVTAAEASNALTRMVQVGVGTMGEFANATSLVTPTAAALDVELNHLFASLAFLTQRGYSASRASTSLNAALTSLAKPSEAMKEAFAELGVNGAEELIASSESLNDVFAKLIGTTDGTQEQIQAMFGNIRGARAVNTIANDIDSANVALQEFNTNLDEATESAWNEQMKSFQADLKLFTSALQGLAIVIGDILVPIIQPIIKQMTVWINKISELDPKILTFGITVLGLVAAIGPLTWVLGTVIGMFSGWGAAVAVAAGLIVTNFGKIKSAFDKLGITEELTELKDSFTDIWTDIFPEEAPALPEYTLVELGASDFVTIKEGDTLSSIWEEQFRSEFATLDEFMGAIVGEVDPYALQVGQIIEVETASGATELRNQFGEVITRADLGNWAYDQTVASLQNRNAGLSAVGLYDWGTPVAEDVSVSVKDRLKEKFDNFDLGEATTSLTTAFTNMLKGVADWIVSDGLEGLSFAVGWLLAKVSVLLIEATAGVIAMVRGVFDGLANSNDLATEGVTFGELGQDMGDSFMSGIAGGLEGFDASSTTGAMQEDLAALPQAIMNGLFDEEAFTNMFSGGNMPDWLKNLPQNVWNAIVDQFVQFFNGEGNTSTADTQINFMSLILGALFSFGSGGGGASSEGNEEFDEVATEISDGIVTSLDGVDWIAVFKDVGKNMLDGLKTAFTEGIPEMVGDMATNLGNAVKEIDWTPSMPEFSWRRGGGQGDEPTGANIAMPVPQDVDPTDFINAVLTALTDENALEQMNAAISMFGSTVAQKIVSAISAGFMGAPAEGDTQGGTLASSIFAPLITEFTTALAEDGQIIPILDTFIENLVLKGDEMVETVGTIARLMGEKFDAMWANVQTPIENMIDALERLVAKLSSLKDAAAAVGESGNAAEIGQSFSGRAIGGSVFGGNPYMVGERGAELFVPNTSGRIIPTHALNNRNNNGGGNTTVNNVNITEMTDVDRMLRELRRRGIIIG